MTRQTGTIDRECPDCHSPLGANATYCGCGWGRLAKGGKSQPEEPRTQCAYMACPKRAILKVKVATHAWSNFCYDHYQAHYQAQAEETCERLGLKTPAQMRAYFLQNARRLVNRVTAQDEAREPGEDREEAPASSCPTHPA